MDESGSDAQDGDERKMPALAGGREGNESCNDIIRREGGVRRSLGPIGQFCTGGGGKLESNWYYPTPEVGPARFGLATFRLSAGRSNRAKLRAHRAGEI